MSLKSRDQWQGGSHLFRQNGFEKPREEPESASTIDKKVILSVGLERDSLAHEHVLPVLVKVKIPGAASHGDDHLIPPQDRNLVYISTLSKEILDQPGVKHESRQSWCGNAGKGPWNIAFHREHWCRSVRGVAEGWDHRALESDLALEVEAQQMCQEVLSILLLLAHLSVPGTHGSIKPPNHAHHHERMPSLSLYIEQWLQRHPEAGSSWPSWPRVSHPSPCLWLACRRPLPEATVRGGADKQAKNKVRGVRPWASWARTSPPRDDVGATAL